MKKRRSKRVKNRRKLLIIGGYWILFVALMGIFSSSLFKFSADAPKGYTDLGKAIKPSVLVVKEGTKEGMQGQHIGIQADGATQINGVTGDNGYSNEGDFKLVQKGDSIYLQYGSAIVKTLYFYITNESLQKTGIQVSMSAFPLLDSKDQLDTLKPYPDQDVYRLLTVSLNSGGKGGSVIGFTKNSSGTTTSGESGGSGVGVGVPIPAPGGPSELNNAESYTYDGYICAIYYWALNIGFGLTLLMILYAGYRYMTAAGNDSVFTETKDVLTSAILGFLLLLCIRLVLHFLNVPEPSKCFTGGNDNTNATTSMVVHPYAVNNIASSVIPDLPARLWRDLESRNNIDE